MSEHHYRVLTRQEMSQLRMERVRALEADRYRAELNLVDALSTTEADSILADITSIDHRLRPHYEHLAALFAPATQAEPSEPACAAPDDEGDLPAGGVPAVG